MVDPQAIMVKIETLIEAFPLLDSMTVEAQDRIALDGLAAVALAAGSIAISLDRIAAQLEKGVVTL